MFVKQNFRMGRYVFGFIPISISKTSDSIYHTPASKTELHWLLFSLGSVFLSLSELYIYLSQSPIPNLLVTQFQLFIIFGKLGTLFAFISFNKNARHVCQFFNYVFSNQNGVVSTKLLHNKWYNTNKKETLFSATIYCCSLGGFCMFVFMLPLIMFFFPCLDSKIKVLKILEHYLLNSNNNSFVQCIQFLVDMLLFIPSGIACSVSCTACLVALHEINTSLWKLR